MSQLINDSDIPKHNKSNNIHEIQVKNNIKDEFNTVRLNEAKKNKFNNDGSYVTSCHKNKSKKKYSPMHCHNNIRRKILKHSNDKREPHRTKHDESTFESSFLNSQYLNLGQSDSKNASTKVKGISTIADTYDQYHYMSKFHVAILIRSYPRT